MNVTDKIAEVYSVDGDEFSELNIKKNLRIFCNPAAWENY